MRIKSWLKYFVYILLICILISLKEVVIGKIEVDYMRNFRINYVHLIFIPFIFNVLIGILLGIDHLIEEIKKDGMWKINLPQIILLGLPSLFFSLTYLYGFLKFESYKILGILTSYGANFIPVFQIIFGYTCITCLYKHSKKV